MTSESRRTASVRLPATLEATRSLNSWIDTLLGTTEFRAFRRRKGDIELALHEVITNVIMHAFGVTAAAPAEDGVDVREQHLDIDAEMANNLLVFRVRDRGAAFDALAYVKPDPAVPQVHGYGLMILDQLCESCVYARSENGENTWDVSFAPNLTSVR